MHVLPGTSRDFVRLREDLGAFGRLAGFMVGIREKKLRLKDIFLVVGLRLDQKQLLL